ncbi:MAG: sigma-54-dependent Fis family transcriptional regulator [Chitinivibrionales bacterium]|nr:sigma-54-dependent Fis family transcriptional regulator [Chitinivibrionales bacterium]
MESKKTTILIVEDNEAALFAYETHLAKAGFTIITAMSVQDARLRISENSIDAVLLDLILPDGNSLELISYIKQFSLPVSVIVITGSADIPTAVTAMKNGADNFLTKPVDMDAVEAALQKALELNTLRRKQRAVQRSAPSSGIYFGSGAAIQSIMNMATIAAKNSTVVLIQGETGTGKGILARWIHEHSDRCNESFVELNCSALKGELLRSELYGHARGAYTSAVKDREGLIEVAHKGTLFLDEIGDMDMDVQAQLLKTIEEKTFRRIGENSLRKSDFRLICATNHDLLKACDTGKFRSDLYYRICVFPIQLQPLRSRTDDIMDLADHIAHKLGYQHENLPDGIRLLLLHYKWPGNIRELRNVFERALLLAEGQQLSPEHFQGLPKMPGQQKNEPFILQKLRHKEKEYIFEVLQACSGDKAKTSKVLGISLATLYRKIGSGNEQ